MAAYGRGSPGGQLYGGGKHLSVVIADALMKARGSAYNTDEESIVYCRAIAAARELAGLWAFMHRIKWLWDAELTPFVGRWESILGLRGNASLSMSQRRAAIAERLYDAPCVLTPQLAADIAKAKLSMCTVTSTRTPGSGEIAFSATKPTAMTPAVFEAMQVSAFKALDDALPSWVSLPTLIAKPTMYLLDEVSLSATEYVRNVPAYAAFSTRLLRRRWTGASVRVRRSSDNAEQDIFFANGVLNTSALLTFVNGGTGYVTKWYDQSGNGRHYTQTNTSLQPTVAVSGVAVGIDTHPALHSVEGGMTIGFTPPPNEDVYEVYVVRSDGQTPFPVKLCEQVVMLRELVSENVADEIYSSVNTYYGSDVIKKW